MTQAAVGKTARAQQQMPHAGGCRTLRARALQNCCGIVPPLLQRCTLPSARAAAVTQPRGEPSYLLRSAHVADVPRLAAIESACGAMSARWSAADIEVRGMKMARGLLAHTLSCVAQALKLRCCLRMCCVTVHAG